jgi:hypothetical protein
VESELVWVSENLKGLTKERQQKILRWVGESLDLEGSAPPASPPSPARPDTAAPSALGSQAGHATDIKTFVDSKNPKSDNQFAAVVAYYYAFEAPSDQRLDAISAEVLQEAARLTRRKRMAKPLVTLNHAKSQGYLDIADRGQYRINSVGENLVAMALPSAANAATPPRKPAKRRGRVKAKAPAGRGPKPTSRKKRT